MPLVTHHDKDHDSENTTNTAAEEATFITPTSTKQTISIKFTTYTKK